MFVRAGEVYDTPDKARPLSRGEIFFAAYHGTDVFSHVFFSTRNPSGFHLVSLASPCTGEAATLKLLRESAMTP
jgi:hypothetical protein